VNSFTKYSLCLQPTWSCWLWQWQENKTLCK